MKGSTRGQYVIAVYGYKDTQYGEADYPDSWFVSGKKYVLGKNISKIKKFDSYQEAEHYIKSRTSPYTRNRTFNILYLTGKWWIKDQILSSFFSLEKKTAEAIDMEIIDDEINAIQLLLKVLKKILADLSEGALKKKEEYSLQIINLKKQIKFLKRQKDKVPR